MFAMSSIQWLHLHMDSKLDFPTNIPVSNLRALKELCLSGGMRYDGQRGAHFSGVPYLLHIYSESLEIVNVESLGDCVYVDCTCPQLRQFSCGAQND